MMLLVLHSGNDTTRRDAVLCHKQSVKRVTVKGCAAGYTGLRGVLQSGLLARGRKAAQLERACQ